MNQIRAGAVLNYVIIALNILSGLLYTPFMLRSLGQNEYGLYALVGSIISYLTLLDFGFGSAIVRYTARTRATGTKQDEWSLYGMFISGYVIIGLLVTIAGIILYFNVDRMFDRTMTPEELRTARIMMAILVFNLAITFPLSVFGAIINAYERFVFSRLLSIIRIILCTGVLIAVLFMGYKAIGLVVVQTVFSLGTLAVNVIYCKVKLKIHISFKNFNWFLLREIMFFSWWNFLGSIVTKIYWSTGQFILASLCGAVAVAIYSLAVSITGMYFTMSESLNSVLLPRLTKLAVSRENDKEISDIFIRTGRLQFCVLALVISGFIVFGKSFISLWAGAGYDESFVITLMFFAVLLCPLIQNVGIFILVARGTVKFRSLCLLFIALFCCLFQYIFARSMGAIGCGIGVTLALFIGQWLIMNIYYQKYHRIDIISFWRHIIRMAIVPIIITGASVVIAMLVDIDSWLKFAIGILMFICVYLPLFWKFSMNRYEHELVTEPLGRVFHLRKR